MNDQEDIKRVSPKWDFGKMPLKDSQISKTVQSIDIFLAYIDNPHVQPTRDQLNCMSFIKAQFTSCIKEDQWNWFTVWTRLGRPDREYCRRISNSINNIRDACKQQKPTLLTEAISTIKKLDIDRYLQNYLNCWTDEAHERYIYNISIAKAKGQIANIHLLDALKTCRTGNVSLEMVKTELDICVEHLYKRKAYGVVLSAYYIAGKFGKYTVEHLLQRMYEVRDYPSFLKQAYRFDIYEAFRTKIDEAIAWHIQRGMPDAEAWQRKFAKLHEQEMLRHTPVEPEISVQIQEDVPEKSKDTPKLFELKPIVTKTSRPRSLAPAPDDDPYIISQTARVKLEQANAAHKYTLSILKEFLQQQSLPVSESKLIDAYSILSSGPAIFEVKSITEANEREQIRHALSQLYEYRFLHSLPEATLWIVCSQELSSQWYVDYLTGDRGVHVVWLQNDELHGPSVEFLQ
jgi:hypothetical protein